VNTYGLIFIDLTGRLGWRFPMPVLWTALVGCQVGVSDKTETQTLDCSVTLDRNMMLDLNPR
jgi:hypothetical protein